MDPPYLITTLPNTICYVWEKYQNRNIGWKFIECYISNIRIRPLHQFDFSFLSGRQVW